MATAGRSAPMKDWAEITEKDLPKDVARQEIVTYISQLRAHFSGIGPAQARALNAAGTGKDAAEIAQDLGVSRQSIEQSLRLGRARMRKILGDDQPFMI